MPLQFESSGTAFVLSGTFIAIPKPAGLVNGEFLLAFVQKNVAGVGLGIWTIPSGWFEFEKNDPGNLNPKTLIAFKVADAGDVAASDFTFSHSDATSPNLNGVLLRISGVLGIDGRALIQIPDVAIAPMVCPSFVTTKDNELIIRALMFDTTGAEPSSITPPAGVTLRGASIGPQPPFSSDSQIHVYTDDVLKTPPGATGTKTFTPVGAVGSERGLHYTVAISPTVPGSGGIMGGVPAKKQFTKADVLAAREQAIATGAKVKNKFDPRRR